MDWREHLMNVFTPGWVAVARETFKYNMRPWLGRRHENWLRDSVRPHPVDPRGQVLVPQRIYDVFKKRPIFSRVTRAELAAIGYPELPRDPIPQPEPSVAGRAAIHRSESPIARVAQPAAA
jgi:hypothetical protein